jgi:hypothetical protein
LGKKKVVEMVNKYKFDKKEQEKKIAIECMIQLLKQYDYIYILDLGLLNQDSYFFSSFQWWLMVTQVNIDDNF